MADQVFGFGNVDFKEDLLQFITERSEESGMDSLQAIEDVLEVVSHMGLHAHRRDSAIKEIYDRAKRDAKKEIMLLMNNQLGI